MLRPLTGIVVLLVVLACVWAVNVLVYADADEKLPGWLLTVWFVLWGTLLGLVVWTLVGVLRSRRAGTPPGSKG